MKNKTLLITAFLAVLFAAIAVNIKESEVKVEIQGKFLPDLASQVDSVSDINITTKETEFDIKTNELGQWGLKQKSGYPVDMIKVREVVIGLADLQIIEKKTDNPEYFASLGVVAPKDGVEDEETREDKKTKSEDSATGIRIVLGSRGDNKILADVILGSIRKGAYGTGMGGFYIRNYSENQIYLVKADMDVETNMENWLDKSLLRIAPGRIKKVTINYSGKNKVEISREENVSPFVLEDMEKGKSLKSPGQLEGIASVVAALDFEDVKPLSEVDFPKEKSLEVFFESFDGLVIKIMVVREDKQRWIKLEAIANEAGEAVIKEAEEINRKVISWAYQIPEYASNILTIKKSELLK